MKKWDRILRGTVGVIAWTAAVLLFFYIMGMVIGGYFREFWVLIALATSMLFVALVRFLWNLCLQNEPGLAWSGLLNQSIAVKGVNTLNQSNEQPVINNPSQVVINNPQSVNVTNNKVQGGIIGSGTVNVHQYFEGEKPPTKVPDDKTVQAVQIVESEDTSDIEDLLDFAQKLLGRPLAENTVRNILERAEIESCGNEKRGRAWAKLYPKQKALTAIAEYVNINK